jgi:hypothetical protein
LRYPENMGSTYTFQGDGLKMQSEAQWLCEQRRTNQTRPHTRRNEMKNLFVATLFTAMAVPVMFAQATPATDTKPTVTTKSTTKAKKHAKKTTAAPASASTTKPVAPAVKN